MSRKEPTRHQLSSRLAYSQSTPAFLQRLKNQVSGGSSYRDDEHAESAAFDEWEASSGRVPIPRRPQSEHGDDDANKDNDKNDFEEDETDDEKPMVVVLKEGRHLSATEADDERRKAKGLPPKAKAVDEQDEKQSKVREEPKVAGSSLSFSSTGAMGAKGPLSGSAKKRKAVGTAGRETTGSTKPEKKAKTKKVKTGTLLSFNDGDDG